MKLTETQTTKLSQVNNLVEEIIFSFYYEEGDKYPELKTLLCSLMEEGVEEKDNAAAVVDHLRFFSNLQFGLQVRRACAADVLRA